MLDEQTGDKQINKQAKQTKQHSTMAEILAAKKAIVHTVRIQIDGEMAVKIEEMQKRLIEVRHEDRRSNMPDKEPDVQAELDRLLVEAEGTIVTFSFRSIGRPAFESMVRRNKPDQEDKKDGSIFNTKTFPPELVAAASVEPKISLDQAKEMFNSDSWNNAELIKVFLTAQAANTESPDIPLFSNVSAVTPATESK